MRSVLLGTGAFPPIIRLWFEMFKKWQDEVDEVIVAVDHYSEPSTRDYIVDLVKQFPKARLMEGVRGWPDSYTDAYRNSKADTFLLMHDDCYIHKRGIADKYFTLAEKGQVAVPMQEIYSPSDWVNTRLSTIYPDIPPPYSFLLYFLFISRKNLEQTSINFNGVGFQRGIHADLFGGTVDVEVAGDTGFLTTLELLHKKVPFHTMQRSETAGIRFHQSTIPQLISLWKNKEGIFSSGWLHLQNTGNTIPLWFNSDIDARIWHKEIEGIRLAWLQLMMGVEDYKQIPEFKKRMENIYRGVTIRCGMSGQEREQIDTISNLFHILLNND